MTNWGGPPSFPQAALKDAKQSKNGVDKEIVSLQSEIAVSAAILPLSVQTNVFLPRM